MQIVQWHFLEKLASKYSFSENASGVFASSQKKNESLRFRECRVRQYVSFKSKGKSHVSCLLMLLCSDHQRALPQKVLEITRKTLQYQNLR